ncbi:MAG: SCO family protein [Pseudomonadota bacterium]
MKRLLSVLALIGCTLLTAGCDKIAKKPLSFNNNDITGLEFGRDFALTDHNGKARTLADFKGKVVLMFFGFTHCPDVCPTTMAEMAGVMQALGPQADEVQVLFVTVDPERDTQALLSQYVPAFDKRFLGLRGDAAATAKVAKEFKIHYGKVEGSSPNNYSVDHTSASYVFDRKGKIRLLVRHGNGPIPIVHDLKQLLS